MSAVTEIYKSVLQIIDQFKDGVDSWDFKQYVLGMLFYRFISENLTKYINENEPKGASNYAQLSDKRAESKRVDTVKEKGFYILPSELFINVWKNARNDDNLNETLSRVFKNIEASADTLTNQSHIKGIFNDLDLNSSKLGNTVLSRVEKLIDLLESIGKLDIRDFGWYIFSGLYEYIRKINVINNGKMRGEFYTPRQISKLLVGITTSERKQIDKVYDPTCGYGPLLLEFINTLGRGSVKRGFWGQEINPMTYNLCRMNMFLNGVNYKNFNIALGDTLTNPKHWADEPFDVIVSNPPYSIKWEGKDNPILINDPRFAPAGVLAPKSKADLAFTMHILSWLSISGTAAIVEFPGVLYRGGAEQKIRKYLIDNNYIDTVIQLPPDLFFGTSIATCIIVLKKSKQDNKTLFIDASAEFQKSGNKNKLSTDNRKKILDAFKKREDIEYFSKVVDNSEIADNDYNIAVSSYVETEDTREVIDIMELNKKIRRLRIKRRRLESRIDNFIASLEE